MKNKKLLTILGVTTLLVGGMFVNQNYETVEAASQPATLYLKPNSNWTQSSARFAAYFFGNGETWVGMTDTDKDGIYEVATPTAKTYPSVIFCRMNPGAAANNWNNKWNQTGDLSIPTNGTNLYTVKDGTWDKGGGTWSVHHVAGEEVDPSEDLLTLFGTYTNEGFYVRETEIYADATEIAKDLTKNHPGKSYENLFHAKATTLNRTTYFEGDQLWMTNSDGTINSGYGTDANGKMNHFKYENGVKKVDYTVSNSTGMEDWYITMKDMVATEEQKWSKNGNVYESKDPTLIEKFKAFTAPCFEGFEDIPNYIVLEKVQVEEVNSTLELRLYASTGDSGKLTTDDLLFSKATVKALATHTLPGEFNGWDSATSYFHVTDLGTNSLVREMTLEAGSYKFKVFSGEWRGNNSTITDECLDWDFKTSEQSDCTLKITESGTYKFTWNVSTGKLSIARI